MGGCDSGWHLALAREVTSELLGPRCELPSEASVPTDIHRHTVKSMLRIEWGFTNQSTVYAPRGSIQPKIDQSFESI